MNVYSVGTLVRLTFAVTAGSGAPAAPSTVALTLRSPDGSVTDLSAAVVNDGVGLYHADYLPSEVGVYLYYWVAAGAADVTEQGKFQVTGPTFAGSGV